MALTIELPQDQEAALKARAQAHGLTAEEYARQVLAADLYPVQPRRHISEVIGENMSDVPPDVLASLPSDGASEHDHYIYGWAKRKP